MLLDLPVVVFVFVEDFGVPGQTGVAVAAVRAEIYPVGVAILVEAVTVVVPEARNDEADAPAALVVVFAEMQEGGKAHQKPHVGTS